MGKFSNTPVKVLTVKDFDSSLTAVKTPTPKPGLIVFYQEWCGYCQMVAPALIELAKNQSYSVYAVEGDFADNMKIFEKMQIQGVPNIHYISASGKIAKPTYMGARDILSFAKFINSKTKPAKKAATTKPAKKATKKPAKKVKSAPVKKQSGGAKKATKKPAKKVTKKPAKKVQQKGCAGKSKCSHSGKCKGGKCSLK